MAKPLTAIDYLDKPAKHPAAPVCVVFGDEPFLKREALTQLRREVLGKEDGEFSLTVLTGRDAEMRDVVDELSTVSMFGGGKRLVVIEEADDFVKNHRPQLEDYVAKPASGGVLVLEVKTWASTTRLYKALASSGLQIQCKTPTPAKLLSWLRGRAKKVHHAKLDPAAAEMLVDMVESELGLLDQELAKLALLAGTDGTIDPSLVQQHVGSWRAQTTWDLIDTAAQGDAQDALRQLDRLILSGENPIALLGQIASTLRKFGTTTQLIEQAERAGRRPALRASLEQAGFKPFVLEKAERQLRQIGRSRASQLFQWLLDADLALKGASSSPPRARLVLEELIVRLSTVADPRRAKASV